MEDMMEVNEAINKYYALKMEYDMKTNNIKKKISSETNNNREKRRMFKKIKLQCINCNRYVKTNFQTIFNKNTNSRNLIASCGDKIDPCDLNININLGYCEILSNIIKENETIIQTLKNNIIKEKNNLLFGYTTSEKAIEHFEKIKIEINEYTEMLNMEYEIYFHITNNKIEKEELNNIKFLIYENIEKIKKNIKLYTTTHNTEFINNVCEIYINELQKLLQQRMSLNYHTNMIKYDDNNQTYTLIQTPYTINDFEQLNEKPSIISYVTGTFIQTKGISKKDISKKGISKKDIKLRVKNDEPIFFGDSDSTETTKSSQN